MVSAAILNRAPAAFLPLEPSLNSNRLNRKSRTKNAEKPPFQAIFLPKVSCVDKKDAARNGAPHSRAALLRSASVLLQKKTLAEKEPFAPSMLNSPGFHKNNHTIRCGYFYVFA